MRIRITAPPQGGSKSIQRTANAPWDTIEGMNIHYRCLHVTVKPGRSSPMSLFRGVAEAALYCAHRAICMFPPSLLTFSSREGGLFGLPLRASNEHLSSVRVARAQEANRPPIPSLSFFPLRPQGEPPDCPSLRASDEHSFIVRVLRARRMVWRFPIPLDRGTPRLAMIPAT